MNEGSVTVLEVDMYRLPRVSFGTTASSAPDRTSAGLGLAIVRSIMSLHNGHVLVTSETDKETAFSLFFPGHLVGRQPNVGLKLTEYVSFS